MEPITRRSFITLSLRLAAMMGLGSSAVPAMADALERIVRGRAPALWLQGQCCSGCSVSLLDSEPLGQIQPAQMRRHHPASHAHPAVHGKIAATAMPAMRPLECRRRQRKRQRNGGRRKKASGVAVKNCLHVHFLSLG